MNINELDYVPYLWIHLRGVQALFGMQIIPNVKFCIWGNIQVLNKELDDKFLGFFFHMAVCFM